MYRLPRFIVLAKWVPSTLAHSSFLLFLLTAPLQAAESPIQNVPPSQDYPIQTTPMSGGDGSVEQFDHNAYSLPLGNMSMTKRLDFSVGNSFFRNPWVAAPASTEARDGLGPLLNTNSCQGCHLKDGRGTHPPATKTLSRCFCASLYPLAKRIQRHWSSGARFRYLTTVCSYKPRRLAVPSPRPSW